MNDRTIVQHPNGYSGVLMGKSTMMIYDKDDNCILHTCFRTPNTEKELYEVLETMPRFIEILASVEADRKTENSSEKPNNCETCRNKGFEGCEQPCLGCGCCGLYEPKDEPLKTADYCDICKQDMCKDCIADATNPYCVPSHYEINYEPKDEPQTGTITFAYTEEEWNEIQDWKDRMWAEAVEASKDEAQTEREGE